MRIDRLTLRAFMCGSMLGDGSISRQRRSTQKCHYQEGHSLEFFEYLNWKAKFMNEALNVRCSVHKRLDPRNGSTYVKFSTTVSKFFWKLRSLFYEESGQNVIPREFIEKYFNEFALAILFMDDGNMEFQATGLFKTAEIYTMSYRMEDVEWFKDFLKRKFNLDFTIRTRKGKYPFLSLGTHEAVNKFADLIKPYVHESMLYKVYFDYRKIDPLASLRHPPIKIGTDEYIVRLMMRK